MPLSITGNGSLTQTAYNSTLNLNIGRSQSEPALSAAQIKLMTNTTEDGLYWITINGSARQVYCDMNTQGGGWMLYACKVTNTYVPFSTSPASDHMSNTSADTLGRIPDSWRGNWRQLMWRFADRTGKPYITTYTKEEDRGAGATALMSFVENPSGSNSSQTIGGFRRSTDGGTTMSVRYDMSATSNFFFFGTAATEGMSQDHGGSDLYLDLWGSTDASNNYLFSDNANARGTKCIAGYCYLNEPVLYMFR